MRHLRKPRLERPDRFTTAIAAIALLGAAMVLYRQSAYGASLSADSVSYISMARNVLAGHGFMPYHGGYVSAWPPLTSALYAAFSFGVFDPMAVAGPLNAAMFALAVFTVGMWLRRRVESPFVAAWACLSLVFAVSAIRVFDWIWSEPSFILATTLALHWTDRHLEDGKRSSLAWAAAFSAAACLSRYLGAALVIAVALMILLRRGVSWRERFISAAAYSAVSLLPICAWLARNRLTTGLLFGDRGIDELTLARVPPTLAEMANWWLPYVPIPGAEGAAVWATAAALSVAAALSLFALHRWLRADADGGATVPLLAAFAAVYAASISAALMTGAVNIDRYISPMFVPLLLLAALALDRALSWTRRARFGGRIPSFALIGALAAWTAFGGYVAVSDAHARANGDGEGRTSRYFRESETVQYLMQLRGAEWNIGVGYSNEPMRAYLASDGRGIYPHRWRGRTAAALESRQDAPDDTIIVWFHDVVPKSYGASEFHYSPGFEPLGSFQDGDVFKLKRGHPPADPRAGTLILDSHYDVYLHDGALVWVRQPCSDEDARGFAELWAEPADPDDPRADVGESGAVSMNFVFLRYGAKIGDLCVIRRPLPDYPIRRIGIGQNVTGDDEWLYRTAIPMPVSDDARAYYIRKYETVAAGGVPLLSGAEYDVYLDGGELVYLKEPCADSDTRGRFLLSAFPVDVADIPQDRRELGHESLNFAFDEYGVIFGDRCMIRRPLPDYEIKAANVGRWLPDGETAGWSARVRMPPSDETRGRYDAKYESVASGGEPLFAGEYAVHLDGGELVYLKQPCADSDTRGRFTLSAFPFELADIPEERRAAGYESLDFVFDDYGAIFGDRCMIRRPLPDYAVKRVDMGRRAPDGETGGWQTARVVVPPDAETRGRYRAKYDSAASAGAPLARSEYAVYLDGGDLVYLKRPCADEHARGRFLLSVFPADLADIPADRRALGHDSLNFDFADYGVHFGDRCMARRPLPDYAISEVEIGRWIPGEGAAWQTRVAVGD